MFHITTAFSQSISVNGAYNNFITIAKVWYIHNVLSFISRCGMIRYLAITGTFPYSNLPKLAHFI